MVSHAAHTRRAAGRGHAATTAALVTTAIVLGGLVGCSQPAPDAGFNIQGAPPSGTRSATAHPSGHPPAGASVSPTGSASATELANTGTRCTGTKLTVALGSPLAMSPFDAGVLQYAVAVTFTNHSALTCSIYGFPGVALVTAAGDTYDLPRRTDARVSTVYLPPGGTASALVAFVPATPATPTDPTSVADPTAAADEPAGTATPAAAVFSPRYILVTPPDDRDAVRLDWAGGPMVDQRAEPRAGTSVGPVIR